MAQVGRPSKYKEEYATDEYIQGFIDHCKEVKDIVTLCGLAVYMKVCEDTLYEWANKHTEFSEATRHVKQLSKNQMVQGGLKGSLNAPITKLCLSANHGMSEKTEQDITTKGTVTQIVKFGSRDND